MIDHSRGYASLSSYIFLSRVGVRSTSSAGTQTLRESAITYSSIQNNRRSSRDQPRRYARWHRETAEVNTPGHGISAVIELLSGLRIDRVKHGRTRVLQPLVFSTFLVGILSG